MESMLDQLNQVKKRVILGEAYPLTKIERQYAQIEQVFAALAAELSIRVISAALKKSIPRRTLQYRLKELVEQGRISTSGSGRAVTYQLVATFLVPHICKQDVALKAARPRLLDGFRLDFLENYHTMSILSTQQLNALARTSSQLACPDLSAQMLATMRPSQHDLGHWQLDSGLVPLQPDDCQGDALAYLCALPLGERKADEVLIRNLQAMLGQALGLEPSVLGHVRGEFTSARHAWLSGCLSQIFATNHTVASPFEQSALLLLQLGTLRPFHLGNSFVAYCAAQLPLLQAQHTPLLIDECAQLSLKQGWQQFQDDTDVAAFAARFCQLYQRSLIHYQHNLLARQEYQAKLRKTFQSELVEHVAATVRAQSGSEYLKDLKLFSVQSNAQREAFLKLLRAELQALHLGNFTCYGLSLAEWTRWASIKK